MSHLRTVALAVFVLAATGCGEPMMEAGTQTTVAVTASSASPSTTTSTVAKDEGPSATSTTETVAGTTSTSVAAPTTTEGRGEHDDAPPEENTVSTSPPNEPAVPPFGSDIDAGLLAAITADAESRLGTVTIVSIESTVWSDTSLGCPETGMMYATVLTPGHIVVVSGGGSTLEYHTNTQAGTFVTC